jgi:hypothetical protein
LIALGVLLSLSLHVEARDRVLGEPLSVSALGLWILVRFSN